MRSVWAILENRKTEFLGLLFISSLLSAIEALLQPLMLKWLFDEAVLVQDFRRFLFLSLAYLVLGLTIVGLFYVVSLWRKSFENRLILALEQRLLEQALRLDWKSFHHQGAGSFVSRIHKDTLEGVVPALNFVLTIVQEALSTVVFLGVLFYLSWQATLVLLIIAPTLFWIADRIGKRVQKATSEEREYEARFLHVLTDTLKAFRILNSLIRLRLLTLDANRRALNAYLDSTYENHRLLTLQRTWSDIFMNLANTLSMVVGGYYVLVRVLTFGGYLAFINAFWRAMDNSFSLFRRIPEFHRYSELFKRLEEMLSFRPTPYARLGTVTRLRSVRLSYENSQVLNFPDLEIGPGERVLLMGPNGSGKTSLLHILSGYMAPDQGEVVIPERVASVTAPVDLPPLQVRQIVPDPALRAALSLEEVKEQMANALSSGQRQKVAIGALLCQEADLYILDEPLANIDDQSKESVMDLIFSKTAGKTLIVTLHGDETLHQKFDRVVELQNTVPSP
nr:ABC transporter ATP-binding protein [Ardenticatena sp.]